MKGMSIGAAVGMIAAILIAFSPLLLLLEPEGSQGGAQTGWAFMFITIPLGFLIGFAAVVLAFIISIIGIVRSRGTSTSRLVIAIAALVLMISATGIVIPLTQLMSQTQFLWLVIFPIAGLVGFVLAIVTGFTAPPRKVATQVASA